ncbi:MAG: glycosyltransferase family 4 protein [Bacillota bacterium]
MRVFMLSWEYPPKIVGGIARHVQDLSRALSKAGHEITVFTSETPNIPSVRNDYQVRVHCVPNQTPPSMDFLTWVLHLNFSMVSAAIPLMNDSLPDIIHVHDWLTMYAGRVLKFAYKVPLVGTIHATEYGRNNGLHTSLQRYISDMEWTLAYDSWKVICCSREMQQEIRNIFQVPEDKLKVIPNGVDSSNFKRMANLRRSNYAADQEKIVFFIGRLVREKGVSVLLEAVPLVLAAYPAVKFVISGTGPLSEILHARAKDLNIYHRIFFTGFIDDPERNFLYRVADVSVFPSLYEPFGIVALESMAAGTPVVVSDTGGLSSIVKHGLNGLKSYAGDPRSLADNIVWALEHPGEMTKMAQKARREVKTIYNWDNISSRTLAVYQQVTQEYQKSDWKPYRNFANRHYPSQGAYVVSELQ